MLAFERFSASAKTVLDLAHEEAAAASRAYIGTEHLLLGLVREPEGLGGRALRTLGVEEDKVRAGIAAALGGHALPPRRHRIPTARVKTVIELAFKEAVAGHSTTVGTEHLLLGLLVEGQGVGAAVLNDLGATLPRVQVELARP